MKLAPQNIELERQVICGLMINPKDFVEFILPPDIFYDDENRQAYEAMLKLFREDKEIGDIGLLSVYSGLASSWFATITLGHWVTSHQLKHDVDHLLFKRKQRRLLELSRRIYNESDQVKDNKGLLELEANIVNSLTEQIDDGDDKAAVANIANRLFEELSNGQKVPVIKTGLPTLDNLSKGLRPGFLWAVGASSGTGKSFFVLNLILQALKQQKKVALFSLEMSQDVNFLRMLGMRSNRSALDLADGFNDDSVNEGFGWLADQKFWIYDNQMTCPEIYERTRRLDSKQNLDLVVIDYLQLISGPGSLYETMSEAVGVANRIAKVCKCAVVLVSQLSNETIKAGEKSAIPGYKGAGDIVAGVDLGLILERPKNQDGEVLTQELNVKIIKNRHNPSGNVTIRLNIDYPSGLIYEPLIFPTSPAEVVAKMKSRADLS